MNILFFGTPTVAVPFLDWLTQHAHVVGVVCRPDEPAGRGYSLTPPPTKRFAVEKGIPVFQPSSPWAPDFAERLAALGADLGVVVAYGRILPRPVFVAPRLGSLNIHFSLLPSYRGAAPIQWSLIRGETRTGVTAFWLDEGLDDGPIFHQSEVVIAPADDVKTLRDKLVAAGLEVLARVLSDAESGRLRREPQMGTPTVAPLLKKEDGRIFWARAAREIVNLIRGVVEWPGASTTYRPGGEAPKTLKILRASWAPGPSEAKPARIVGADPKGIAITTGEGIVRLEDVQPEGKKPMSAWSFWQGARLKIGDRLGEE